MRASPKDSVQYMTHRANNPFGESPHLRKVKKMKKMKLRNRKIGEIRKAEAREDGIYLFNEHTRNWWKYELDLLASDWEYYVEPLIKDEKIRKTVQWWAYINSIEKVIYAERSDRSLCNLTDMGDDDYDIEFVGWIPTLKDGEEYTIAELCGEEEE